MPKSNSASFDEEIIERLRKDPEMVEAYLNAALEEENDEVFFVALKRVIQSQSKMSTIAKKSNLNRENLYRMLSDKGNPQLSSILMLLHALGLKFLVTKEQIS